MPESSVDSYINAQPEQAMSFEDYWKQSGYFGSDANPDSFSNKFFDFFSGDVKRARSEYETYLNNINARNEYLATQSARAWDKMMDDSKVQRSMKDYEAAGLNPYLLINSGSVGGGSAPTSAKADYKYDRNSKAQDKANKMRDSALLLIAIARLAAAFL